MSKKQTLLEHIYSIALHDIVSAIYELYHNRLLVAMTTEQETYVKICYNFTDRSNLFHNIEHCVYCLDDILSDDIAGDMARALFEESIMIKHPQALFFYLPLIRSWLDLTKESETTKLHAA